MCLYHNLHEAAAAIMTAIDAANGMNMKTMVKLGRYEAVGHKDYFVYRVQQLKSHLDIIHAHIDSAIPALIEAVEPPMPPS
jgi:hypothetical protein